MDGAESEGVVELEYLENVLVQNDGGNIEEPPLADGKNLDQSTGWGGSGRRLLLFICLDLQIRSHTHTHKKDPSAHGELRASSMEAAVERRDGALVGFASVPPHCRELSSARLVQGDPRSAH